MKHFYGRVAAVLIALLFTMAVLYVWPGFWRYKYFDKGRSRLDTLTHRLSYFHGGVARYVPAGPRYELPPSAPGVVGIGQQTDSSVAKAIRSGATDDELVLALVDRGWTLSGAKAKVRWLRGDGGKVRLEADKHVKAVQDAIRMGYTVDQIATAEPNWDRRAIEVSAYDPFIAAMEANEVDRFIRDTYGRHNYGEDIFGPTGSAKRPTIGDMIAADERAVGFSAFSRDTELDLLQQLDRTRPRDLGSWSAEIKADHPGYSLGELRKVWDHSRRVQAAPWLRLTPGGFSTEECRAAARAALQRGVSVDQLAELRPNWSRQAIQAEADNLKWEKGTAGRSNQK